MRLRNIKGAEEIIQSYELFIEEPKKEKGKWNVVFQNNNPIYIEIGMGKGRFLLKQAQSNPNINYIGVERYSSVLLRALERHQTNEFEHVENIRFICMDARELNEVFHLGEVDKIYLNFSDPWPKSRHSKRRLTSVEFLQRYKEVLGENGIVEFKTDNKALFLFSLEQAKEAKWNVIASTFDLHKDEDLNRNNIMTEYEEKFSKLGNPIHKMIISGGN